MSLFSNYKRVSNSKASFQISDLDLSIVNSIRRIGIQEIPTVALDFDVTGYRANDHVVIHKNTGVLHNEFLMHRISLVPFHFSLEEIDAFDPEAYVFKLKVSNKTPASLLAVTTKDIVIYDAVKNKEMDEAFHKRILPANDITHHHILLTHLKFEEELDIEFKLAKKTAESHSRWSPVSQCTFSFVENQDGKSIGLLSQQRNYKKNKFGEPNEYRFIIQSECGIKPAQIFQRAIEILIQKTNDFITALENKESKVILETTPTENFYHIHIDNEDHTLVNMLHSCIYNHSIRDHIDKRLDYIGYYQPHPLHKSMLMKLKLSDGIDPRSFLIEKGKSIQGSLETILADWINFSSSI